MAEGWITGYFALLACGEKYVISSQAIQPERRAELKHPAQYCSQWRRYSALLMYIFADPGPPLRCVGGCPPASARVCTWPSA